jgi:hypothetical protein
MSRSTYRRWLWALCCSSVLALGCAQTSSSGGDTGSETHWLGNCASDSDCTVGQCLCGLCTEACAGVADCPAPLDVCTVPETPWTDSACQTRLCGSSEPGEVQASLEGGQRLETCEGGRPIATVFYAGKDRVERASSLDGRGFVLERALDSAAWIDPEGRLIRDRRQPSGLAPTPRRTRLLDDGGLLVGGDVDAFDGTHPWIGRLDASWSLLWETQLAEASLSDGVQDLAILPGGDAIIVSRSLKTRIQYDPLAPELPLEQDLWFTRVSADGALLWRQSLPFVVSQSLLQDSYSLVLTDDGELRTLVNDTQGTLMIRGALDGSPLTALRLDFWLPDLRRLVKLPERRMAALSHNVSFATTSRLVVLDEDGLIVAQRVFTDALPSMVFEPVRRELLLAGARGRGGLMLATGLTGETVWELARAEAPTDFEGVVTSVGAGQAPPLVDVAVNAQGTFVAVGRTSVGLAYLVGAGGSCSP